MIMLYHHHAYLTRDITPPSTESGLTHFIEQSFKQALYRLQQGPPKVAKVPKVPYVPKLNVLASLQLDCQMVENC